MGENTNSSSSSSSSGCPVAKDAIANAPNSNSNASSGWGSWLGWAPPNKTSTTTNNTNTTGNGCPVPNTTNQQKPASLEEAAAYAQTPHPDQKGVALSTHRVISSIPRGASKDDKEQGPHHQTVSASATPKPGHPQETTTPQQQQQQPKSNWIYPSEQQFFHALRKKGWDHVEAAEIPSVLEIHNTVNERTWKQVVRWEEGMDRDCTATTTQSGGNGAVPVAVETNLKLVRFEGRPQDLSPQAFFWTKILRWTEPPFDRHDWYVQKQPRQNTSTPTTTTTKETNSKTFPIQRYVIDYYMIPNTQHPDMPPTPYVDARPALDSPRAFYLRAWHFLQEELPGLASEYGAWKARQRHYFDGRVPTAAASSASTT